MNLRFWICGLRLGVSRPWVRTGSRTARVDGPRRNGRLRFTIGRGGATTRNLNGGFTLLEMLAAIALMSVIVVSLYSSLHIGFGAYGRAKQAVEPLRTAEIALELLRRDLEGALPPQGILSGPFLGDAWAVEGAAVRFFTTSAAPEGMEPAADVNYVELGVVQSGTTGHLVRRFSASLPSPLPPPMVEEVICRHVELLQFRYFNGLSWQDDWDSSAHDESLPVAVEVTLEIRPDPNEAVTRVRRVIPIPGTRIQIDADEEDSDVDEVED
jgi:general secretion pathway protein J